MLQKRGARIVMDPVDWEMLSRYPNRYTSMSPRRDMDAYDGMPLTLGDTTVTLWRTPGHTPGTLSSTFTVFDGGRSLSVVYSGGTALNFPCSTPDPGIRNLQIYIDSQRHITAQAAAAHATVLLSNHSEFDNALNKVKMLAGRGDGAHPFEVGSELVQRYFEVTRNGARAAQIGLERLAARG